MAGEGTKRIIDLSEAAETQSGDYIAIDSTGQGTRKLPAGFMATAEDLSEEQTARQTADATLDGKITTETENRIAAENALKTQFEVTGTASGAIAHFSDGSTMPAKSVVVNIEPQQSGTGTPSPDNERPISGWESVVLTKAGKNLLKNSVTSRTVLGLTVTRNDDGTIHITGTATNSVALAVALKADLNMPAGTYIVSGCPSGGSSSTYRIYIGATDENGSAFGSLDTGSERTFTVSSFTDIQIQIFPAAGEVDLLFKPMIRLASDTDPTYEPYHGTTTTVNLGRTVYGGTLDVVSGALTVTHGYQLFDGSVPCYNVTTNFGTGFNRALYSTLDSEAKRSSDIPIVSDKFAYTNASALALYKGNINNNGILCLGVPDTITTATEMQAWAGQNPFVIVYELAEPQTYTLTPTEVSTLLGENNVWADSGDVSVVYVRDLNIAINNLIGE